MYPCFRVESNLIIVVSPGCLQGFPVIDAGISKDDLSTLTASVRAALESADLLVTTGGVSMGDRDLLRQVGNMSRKKC